MVTQFGLRLLKVFIFYLLLFAACRLLFLFYFTHDIISEGTGVFFTSLIKALPLDVSTACYLCFIPLLLLFVAGFFAGRFFTLALKIYLVITSLAYVALSVAEIGVYQDLHIKIYYNLLSHLQRPSELIRSVSPGLLAVLFIFICLLAYGCIKSINKLLAGKWLQSRIDWKKGAMLILAFACFGGLLVLGCRGGLRPIPINEGEVYFSHNQCVNDASVNCLWSLAHSFLENQRYLNGKVYQAMPDAEAQKVVNQLFSVQKDTTIQILKTRRPNVCFLILESWAADVVASLNGYQNLSPNFEKLISEGYLFTNIEASGHVSDQGIPAVLSAYPALPNGSAINQLERQVHLTAINTGLKPQGYYSSFFFGGQLIYGNIKTYIYHSSFDRVMEQDNFPSSVTAGRLGIHDSTMLQIWLDSLNRMPQPFLSCLFTLSTHSPYDEPTPGKVDWAGGENPYFNSIIYTDRQFKKFFDAAKKQPWYANTIFIIVADHSHHLPKNYEYDSPEYYHIPLLLYGGALKEEYRGVKDTRIASQTDILSTLLHQMNLPDSNYPWSKNLFNPYTQQFAFYTFNNGFGFVDTTGATVWNHTFPSLGTSTGGNESEKQLRLAKGHAILQEVMRDFFSK